MSRSNAVFNRKNELHEFTEIEMRNKATIQLAVANELSFMRQALLGSGTL